MAEIAAMSARGPIASFPWRPGASGPAPAKRAGGRSDEERALALKQRRDVALAAANARAQLTSPIGPVTTSRLERLGFEVATAHMLEVKPRPGVLMSDLLHAWPNVLTYEAWHQRADFPGTRCSRLTLPVYASWLREALEDMGLPVRIVTVPGVGLQLFGDAAAVVAAVRAYA